MRRRPVRHCLRRGGLKAAASGRMCRDGRRATRWAGAAEEIRRPARHGKGGIDVAPEAVDEPEWGDATAMGRRDESDEVERATRHGVEPAGVGGEERREEHAHEGAEALPGLGHR